MQLLISARKKRKLPEVEFAELFDVSVRTLRDSKELRRNSNGSVKILIAILKYLLIYREKSPLSCFFHVAST